MSAPMDGGAGAMSSSCCSCCSTSSCPKDCIAGISTGVITSAITAIPSRVSLEFITSDSFDHYEKDFSRLCPVLIQIYPRAEKFVSVDSVLSYHSFFDVLI